MEHDLRPLSAARLRIVSDNGQPVSGSRRQTRISRIYLPRIEVDALAPVLHLPGLAWAVFLAIRFEVAVKKHRKGQTQQSYFMAALAGPPRREAPWPSCVGGSWFDHGRAPCQRQSAGNPAARKEDATCSPRINSTAAMAKNGITASAKGFR
jgi:hypothetical protein